MKDIIYGVFWFLSPLMLIAWVYALTKAAMYVFGLPADPAVFFALIMTGTQFGVLIYVQFGSLTNTTEREDEK